MVFQEDLNISIVPMVGGELVIVQNGVVNVKGWPRK